MNRRDFLKLGGILSGALMLPLSASSSLASLPVETIHEDCLYRGTADGRVYVSLSEGRSWQLHTNFGAEFSVFALASHRSGGLHARLQYQGHDFELALAQNGKTWRTV